MSSLVFLESSTVQHVLLLGRYSFSLMALMLKPEGFLAGQTFCPSVLLGANTLPSLSIDIALLLFPLVAYSISPTIYY